MAKCARYTPAVWVELSLFILQNVGNRTESSVTLACICVGMYISPYIEIVNFRSDGKELTRLIKFVENFNLCNLHNKTGCHVVPKVVKYPRIPQLHVLLKSTVMRSVSLIHCNVLLCRACDFGPFLIYFSKRLPVLFRRQFWGHFGSYRIFVRLWFFCVLPRLWTLGHPKALIKLVCQIYKRPPGRCLRHSFGIQSIVNSFPVSINLLISSYHKV
jgi:hypothetical protein